ncbi:MAG: trypsin-like serine protease [Nannocystis sp.]|nr:trypsin-like serine protease [Nannocystis sp.]
MLAWPSLLALIALLAAPRLTAPTPPPQPIIGGERTELTEWTSVVAILGIRPGFQANANLCTGVLVDPTTVLTAAHCFDDAEDFSEIIVVFGDSIYATTAGRRTAGLDYAQHPDYCLPEECTTDAFDFAYLTLEGEAAGVELIPPLVDQAEWDELMRPGVQVTLVGFGATRDTSSEGDAPLKMSEYGLKRATTASFQRLTGDGLEFVAGSEGKDTCGGDSGGPVFAQLAGGGWRLVGITSRGQLPCGTGYGVYGAPYAALPWLREQTGVDLLPASCAAGDCLDTAAAKERGCRVGGAPSRQGGLALLALLFFVRARRRR